MRNFDPADITFRVTDAKDRHGKLISGKCDLEVCNGTPETLGHLHIRGLEFVQTIDKKRFNLHFRNIAPGDSRTVLHNAEFPLTRPVKFILTGVAEAAEYFEHKFGYGVVGNVWDLGRSALKVFVAWGRLFTEPGEALLSDHVGAKKELYKPTLPKAKKRRVVRNLDSK